VNEGDQRPRHHDHDRDRVHAGGRPVSGMPIYRIEGADLDTLVRWLGLGELSRGVDDSPLPTVRIAIDGGVKVKVNQLSWSPPLGVKEERG
jgi:hypothetical protein